MVADSIAHVWHSMVQFGGFRFVSMTMQVHVKEAISPCRSYALDKREKKQQSEHGKINDQGLAELSSLFFFLLLHGA